MDLTVLIGGAAGQGMDTLGLLLAKSLKSLGFYVFLHKDYMSRIRGGHNFVKVRFRDCPVFSHADELAVIIALNAETIELHGEKLRKDGRVIALENGDKVPADLRARAVHLPTKEVIQQTGNRWVVGSAALGCVFKLFGLPLAALLATIGKTFEPSAYAANNIAIELGYSKAETLFSIELPAPWDSILISGNEAVAVGALAAGCKFYAGYPMTPATSIMTYLAKKSNEAPILVEQAEDEIAAINMALGASYAGVRAMTGSSGGGFSLMAEGVSLAGITETPIVIAVAQRPGPATGLPTRTEQSDLSFVVHAGHGEFPRLVVALRHPEDAFCQTVRAFNLAEKYQMPVFLLTDQYLADYTQTVKPFDFAELRIERSLTTEVPADEYLRYELTESGLSPRIVPGKLPGKLVYVDSDEHDEAGRITESAAVRNAMVEKRQRKVAAIHSELLEPEFIGCDEPSILLLCWGSTYGPVKEAVLALNTQNQSIGALVFGDIYPLPTKLLYLYAPHARKIVNLEQNATGQLALLIRQQTGLACDQSLLKYDGRQWSKDEVLAALTKEVL
ncbi:MAG: 2-oxoglutarate oxidoreductase subunit KorA [Firmicutes bacterium]|nr:2-oxoglutarate oxidoreductase subunit KorA [candidate division NPL-UPA2 bacterium]MBT9155572.1 2-oxoglutarate oxidoreductase subunit KorA [candidate division NPL-UPA2 bacterium]